MDQKKGLPGIVILGLGLALAMAIVAIFVIGQAEKSRRALPPLGQVPEFQFVNQMGAPFGRQQMLGQVCVVDFIFTRCPGICPVMANKFSQLYRLYGEASDFQLISISVDPDYDTQEILSQYAQRYSAQDDRWVFLRGPIEEVRKLSEQGFFLPAQDLPQGHSGKFVLVDRQGTVRGYYDHDARADMELLKTHLGQVLKAHH